MYKPLISVIVPVYNQEKYLDRSLTAIKDQQYTNLQVVVVNDGSTDQSLEIARHYEEVDSRFIVLNQDNAGLVSAIITGINHSLGEFVAFVDPDDTVGEDYIQTFYESNHLESDIIAAGYFYVNQQSFMPFELASDYSYAGDALKELRNNFLTTKDSVYTSNLCGIPRWNKLYSRALLNIVANKLKEYVEISLGEDSIFTYLCLRYAKSIYTLQIVNSYYYNIANTSSMMSNSSITSHVEKAELAYKKFSELESLCDDNINQADSLLFLEIRSLLIRSQSNWLSFHKACRVARANSSYIFAIHNLLNNKKISLIDRVKLAVDIVDSTGLLNFIEYRLKEGVHAFSRTIRAINGFRAKLTVQGFHYAAAYFRHDLNRNKAFKDLVSKMPIIEEEIKPYLEQFQNSKTNFDKADIVNNIFVFWWDGFSNAPDIVKVCRASIPVAFPYDKIIEIDKTNFAEYTDIDSRIIYAFERGDISVQTFSDILRFNILKNNGGVWVDATILFTKRSNLLENLSHKSFESVYFDSSNSYLSYRNQCCTWSGYLISSRKSSVLVTVCDYIFQNYYLDHGKYPTYFFIDAVLMLCKIYHIDNDALGKIQFMPGSMFELASLLGYRGYTAYFKRQFGLPQKLYWGYQLPCNCTLTTYDLLLGSLNHGV